MIVEGLVGNVARHSNDAPAGQRFEPPVHLGEIGNRLVDAERAQSLDEFGASMALSEPRLPLGEQAPYGLILGRIGIEVLWHRPIGCHRAVVAAQRVQGGEDFHEQNMEARAGANPGKLSRASAVFWRYSPG